MVEKVEEKKEKAFKPASKRKREAGLNACMVTQYLNKEYWLTDKGQKAIDTVNAYLKEGKDHEAAMIMSQYTENQFNGYSDIAKKGEGLDGTQYRKHFRVLAVYSIIHNKDERKVWSEKVNDLVIEMKPAHVHMVIIF